MQVNVEDEFGMNTAELHDMLQVLSDYQTWAALTAYVGSRSGEFNRRLLKCIHAIDSGYLLVRDDGTMVVR